MSVDAKYGRYCDECGRTIASAVRVHLGKDYCRACYQTTFVKAICSQCNGSMRAHRHASEPLLCRQCIRSERTCLRCGRFTLIAGKLVGENAVCGSCAPHFRDKNECTSCGRLSSRLSKPLFAGLQERVCDSCRSSLTHATCAICSRYRAVQGRDDNDRPYCKECAPDKRLSHQCPSCDSVVPGGGLGRCVGCINAGAIQRDAKMISAQLEQAWARALWNSFIERQVALGVESPALRKRIANASHYFFELERAFTSQAEITSSTLASHIETSAHRKYLLASRFVVEHLGLDAFPESREMITECRRIQDILTRSQGCSFANLLEDYKGQLRQENTAHRTTRLYLRAAEAFCANACVDAVDPWPEKALINHLRHFPGSANSLSRFVSYCRAAKGWDVRMPERARWQDSSKNIKKTLAIIKATFHTASQRPVEEMSLKEVARLLSSALGVPAASLLHPEKAPDCPSTGRSILVIDEGLIEPGDPLYPFARRWADLTNKRLTRPRSARAPQSEKDTVAARTNVQDNTSKTNHQLREN